MKSIKKYILVGAMLAGTLMAEAQEANRSGYFLDGYIYRHELNPAFAPERNFIAIPGIGDISAGVMSNMGVNTFLYKQDNGQLTTFLNQSVNANDFLGKLSNINKTTFNFGVPIIAFGTRGFGGYNTFSFGVHADGGVSLPKDLFTFMKVGQTGADTQYSMKDIRVKASAYAEIALGHQHKINKELSIGAKVKFLLGLGYFDANVKQLDVTLGHNKWAVEAQGEMSVSAKGLNIPTNAESGKELDNPSKQNQLDYDGIDYSLSDIGLAGFGVAFDLGATYDMSRFVDGLTLSASLLDLGGIKWKNTITATTPQTSWSFDGFKNIALNDNQEAKGNQSLDDQLDDMWDDLEDCINFEKEGSTGTRKTSLAATFELGAEYKMPFYKRLTGGFLFTQRFAGQFSWTEGRFSANIKPIKWFDFSVNYGASTYGSSFGWMLNLHPDGLDLFIGSDHQIFKVTPQYVPVGKASAQITVGLTIAFGARK